MSAMWKKLRETLELEPEVDSVTNTYLGCNQTEVDIDNDIIQEKSNLLTRLLHPTEGTTCEQDKKIANESFDEQYKLQEPSLSDKQASGKRTRKAIDKLLTPAYNFENTQESLEADDKIPEAT